MDWGAFAGSVGSGMEQGQRIMQQRQAMIDAARQRAARADVGRALMADAQGNPVAVPMPGATPIPMNPAGAAPGGAPAPAPMPGGGGPVPIPGGGGPAPAPMPGGPPGATPTPASVTAPPMLQARPPAAAAPAQQGPATPPAQQGPATGGGDASGGAGVDYSQAFAASKNLLKSVAKSIQQGNPGKKWKDPAEFLDAVEAQIKTMDSANPMEKIAAQAQIAGSRAQYEYTQNAIRQQEEDRKKAADEQKAKQFNEKLDQAWKIAKNNTDARLKIAAAQNATRLAAEKMIQDGENGRADNLLQYRYAAQQAGIDEKTAIENLRAELQGRGQDIGWLKSEETADINATQKPQTKATTGKAPAMTGAKVDKPLKPLPKSTLAQWKQVPASNKAAAKQHLSDQGFDVSGLN